jgi:RNA polymerase sigma-70 factor (ECF subfamily)
VASVWQSEADLARALLAGEEGAFDRFVETFQSKVFQYSFLMCGQREDAEEVAQEALMKVFESLDQLRDPEHVKPWVFRIAKNACLMKRRKSIFAPPEELSLDQPIAGSPEGEPRTMQIPDRGRQPDRQVMDRETSDALRLAIVDLPETLRSVVLLRDLEELSTEDTAGILGVSNDVVKTRLHRARLALRQKLDPILRRPQ